MKTMTKLISAACAAVILSMSTITANAGCVSTAGYWASHPEAWCAQTIQIGAATYTQTQAIAIMQQSTSGDKTFSLAAQLIAAKLNVLCAGADSTCVSAAMSAADTWLGSHPVGSGVTSNSKDWKAISPTNDTLTLYNEGRLCVPKCRS